MIQINASMVLYHNKKEELSKAINSILNTDMNVKLFLVDNSSNSNLKELLNIDRRIWYIFNNENLGYGRAHNKALRKSIKENVKYHIVINPDIYFEKGVLETLYNFMEKNPDVALVMPKVLYPNGEVQYLCKLLPTPIDLFGRRFLDFGSFKKWINKRNEIYELRFTGYNKIIEVPYLSGCFMFLRVDALREVGLFDERFFMYPEDIDLTRRIHERYKTVYYPYVSIVHEHGKESYESIRMVWVHMLNITKYFNKWGWFFDRKRKIINKKVLAQLRYNHS